MLGTSYSLVIFLLVNKEQYLMQKCIYKISKLCLKSYSQRPGDKGEYFWHGRSPDLLWGNCGMCLAYFYFNVSIYGDKIVFTTVTLCHKV